MDIDEDETLKFRALALFYFPILVHDTRLEWQPGINDVSLRDEVSLRLNL